MAKSIDDIITEAGWTPAQVLEHLWSLLTSLHMLPRARDYLATCADIEARIKRGELL